MPSPWYWAVSELVPAGMIVEGMVATPLVTTPVPRSVEPLKNWTLPVGAAPAPVTFAVSATDCPKVDEVGTTESAVVLAIRWVSTTSLPVPPT